MRTQVAIIGAGPAGLLLSHLLTAGGVESIVVETRTREYVESRIRAGILEHSTVELLRSAGLGDRIAREGDEHRGIYLQWPGERHHLDFQDLVGRSVWVYGQTEVQKDLGRAADEAGQQVIYDVRDTAVHDPADPYVTFTVDSRPERVDADVVVGCDGSFGPTRDAVSGTTLQRTYSYSWLGVLADVAPSTDELIYAWHPDGFALNSMRSPTVTRLYLQVPADTDIAEWPDERIWDALSDRLGHGQDGWKLARGPITDKSVLPMRSNVTAPMRHEKVFLAGDAAHIVPPTGAKGLNLAVADVTLLGTALVRLLQEGRSDLVDSYSETALRRVWRCTHFSWWMTSVFHRHGDDFDARLQLSQLERLCASEAAQRELAENYTGLPIGF